MVVHLGLRHRRAVAPRSAPFFNIVVADSRIRRDGRFIERVGFYNPVAAGGEQPLRVALDRVDLLGRHRRPAVADGRAPGRAGQGRRARAAARPERRGRQRRPARCPRRPPTWPDDAIEVGRIVDAWGIKGWFKVQPLRADPQALFSSRALVPAGRPRHGRRAPVAAATPPLLRSREAKEHGDVRRGAAPQDVADRNAAEALRGARDLRRRAPASRRPATDEYLLGRPDRPGGRQPRGRARSARCRPDRHRSADACCASPRGGRQSAPSERLIPFVAAYVDERRPARRAASPSTGA